MAADDIQLWVCIAGACPQALCDELHRLIGDIGFGVIPDADESPRIASCILYVVEDDWPERLKARITELRTTARMQGEVILIARPGKAPTAQDVFRCGARDLITSDRLDAANLKWTIERAIESARIERRDRQVSIRNSELAAVVVASPDAIMSADAEDRVRSWNPGAEELFGYSEAEALGHTIEELIIPDQFKGERGQLYVHVRAGRTVTGLETERKRKDGSLIWVEVNCSPMYDKDGVYNGFTVVFRDISDRKRTEEALRQSEEKYARAFSGNPAAVSLTTIDDGTFIEVNDTWTKLNGFSRDEVIGKPFAAFESWADPAGRIEFVSELRSNGAIHNWEREFKRKSGEIFIAQLSAQRLKLQGQDVILSTFVDVTEGKQAEAALRDSEAFTRGILEASPDCIDILTAAGDISYMNGNSLQAMRVADFASVAGKRYSEIWPAALKPRVDRAIAMARAGGNDRFEGFCETEQGKLRYWDVAVSPQRDHRNEIRHIIVSSRDMSERRRFEITLRENEQTLRLAKEAVGLGVVTIDYASGRATADAIAAHLFDILPDVPVPVPRLHEMIHPLDREEAAKRIAVSLDPQGSGTLAMEHRIIRRDGATRWVSIKKQVFFGQDAPRTALLMAFDITERKMVELEVVRLNRRLARRIEKTERNFTTYFDLIQNNPFGVLLVDGNFRLAQLSHGARKAFGEIEPLQGRDVSELIHRTWLEPFSCGIINRIRHTLETGESYNATESMRPHSNPDLAQSYDWRIDQVTLSDGNSGVVCHFYDMTERQQYEDKIRLLMREVNHRSKNIMMLVQAVARQTAAQGRDDFLNRFDQRLQALSTSQDLLVQSEWRSVDLTGLLHSQLAHFEDLVGSRIAISGPNLKLNVQAVQPLGMAVHELATNAGKYGALSNESGRVELTWDIVRTAGGDDNFTMAWREFGGPPVEAPIRHGFGSTVLDRMVRMSLGGNVIIGFDPEGYSWEIECPAQHAVERPGPMQQATSGTARQEPILKGPRILVVEDEALVAIEIAGMMENAGWSVVGPASNVSRALRLIEDIGCDCAVLDVNLGRETSEPIAGELEKLGIPYITVSGYSRQQMPERLMSAEFLTKPIRAKALIGAVGRCLERVAVH